MSRQLVVAALVVQALDLATYLQAPYLEANPLVAGLPPAVVALAKVLLMVAAVALAIAARRWRRASARALLELALLVAVVVGAFGVGSNIATLSIVRAAEAPRSPQEPAPTPRGAGFEKGVVQSPVTPGRTAAPSTSAVISPLSPAPASPRAEAAASAGPSRHHSVPRGTASWYSATGLVAAAGPELRRSLGRGWRGSAVRVVAGDGTVVVRLVDWCQCMRGQANERLIDLGDDAFAELAPLAAGLVRVRVQRVELPETDR